MTTIGGRAFYYGGIGCPLISVQISKTVVSIEAAMFTFSQMLTSISLPSSIMFIGVHSFHTCKALQTVIYLGTTELTCYSDETREIFCKGNQFCHYPFTSCTNQQIIPTDQIRVNVPPGYIFQYSSN